MANQNGAAAAAELAATVAAYSSLFAQLRSNALLVDPTPRNADLNAAQHFGVTPLILSVILGHVSDVELLLAAGADPTVEGEVWDTVGNDPDVTKCKRV